MVKRESQLNIRWTPQDIEKLHYIADHEDRGVAEIVRIAVRWSFIAYDKAGSLSAMAVDVNNALSRIRLSEGSPPPIPPPPDGIAQLGINLNMRWHPDDIEKLLFIAEREKKSISELVRMFLRWLFEAYDIVPSLVRLQNHPDRNLKGVRMSPKLTPLR